MRPRPPPLPTGCSGPRFRRLELGTLKDHDGHNGWPSWFAAANLVNSTDFQLIFYFCSLTGKIHDVKYSLQESLTSYALEWNPHLTSCHWDSLISYGSVYYNGIPTHPLLLRNILRLMPFSLFPFEQHFQVMGAGKGILWAFHRGVARWGPGVPVTPFEWSIYLMETTYKSYATHKSEEATWKKPLPVLDSCTNMLHLLAENMR